MVSPSAAALSAAAAPSDPGSFPEFYPERVSLPELSSNLNLPAPPAAAADSAGGASRGAPADDTAVHTHEFQYPVCIELVISVVTVFKLCKSGMH